MISKKPGQSAVVLCRAADFRDNTSDFKPGQHSVNLTGELRWFEGRRLIPET
jgi:hypothetical protein